MYQLGLGSAREEPRTNKEMELGVELGGDFGKPKATEDWGVGDEPKVPKSCLQLCEVSLETVKCF